MRACHHRLAHEFYFATRCRLQAAATPVKATRDVDRTPRRRHIFQSLSVPPALTALFFTFTRKCVAQEPDGLKSVGLLKEYSPSTHHVSPWCPAHYFIVLFHATFIVFRQHCTRLESGTPKAQLCGWVHCLVIWPTPLKPHDQEKHANTLGEMQMGAALADGGRRLDEKAWEQNYDAAAIAGWSPFNRG